MNASEDHDRRLKKSALKRWALKLEGAVWITRPQSLFSKVPLAAAGWLVGRGAVETEAYRGAGLVLFFAAMQGMMFTVNDIVDAKKDAISAPYLPIPSGVATRRTAIIQLLLLTMAGFVGLLLMTSSLTDLAIVLVSMPFALATMKFYGRTKSAWFSSLLASTAFSSGPGWAWMLAGHRNVPAFVLLFGAATLHGMHSNIRAQLRDIEGDPKASNITLAVRLGPRRTFWIAAAARMLELSVLGAVAFLYGARFGWIWFVPTVALFIAGIAKAKSVYAEARDRIRQTEALSLWMYMSFCAEVTALGIFDVRLATVTAVSMFLWFNVVRRVYYGRLANGVLAKEWKRFNADDDAPSDDAPSERDAEPV